jgi:hypothetical protein
MIKEPSGAASVQNHLLSLAPGFTHTVPEEQNEVLKSLSQRDPFMQIAEYCCQFVGSPKVLFGSNTTLLYCGPGEGEGFFVYK